MNTTIAAMIARQTLLALSTGALRAIQGAVRLAAPALCRSRPRLTQDELDHALVEHARWLADRTCGRRADLAGSDLFGLDFGVDNPRQVVLRNADFTEADLSHVRGNDVNFNHASLHRTNLSHSHLKSPVFRCAILHEADCRHVVWGWPTRDYDLRSGPVAAEQQSVFMSTFLSGSMFDHARVRGYFHDCSFTSSSLVSADFSQSQFGGDYSMSNSFREAKLIGTKFVLCRIASARFNQATMENVDFLGSEVEPRIADHLRSRSVLNLSTHVENIIQPV